MTKWYTRNKEGINLSDKPFATGGEGTLYDVIAPANKRHLCAKIYHKEKGVIYCKRKWRIY